MSSLAAINQALLEQLETVEGLRSFAYVPDTLNPPAAVIQPPRVRNNTHQEALRSRDGIVTMWRYRVPITLVLGRVNERDWAERYDHYTDELQRVLPKAQTCHAHVTQLPEARQITIAGADYLAADVVVEVWA